MENRIGKEIGRRLLTRRLIRRNCPAYDPHKPAQHRPDRLSWHAPGYGRNYGSKGIGRTSAGFLTSTRR